MDTLEYIKKKYKLDLNQPMPIPLPIGRMRDMPKLFNELGFKVGAEIGVFEGTLTNALLRRIPGLKMYGVDLWENYEDYKDDLASLALSGAYEKAVENTKGFDCTLIRGWSNEVVKQFEDGSLDFVYIDGNHKFEYAIEDIALWAPKVRKGGIIAGHDYKDWSKTNRWNSMQVKEAVDAYTKVKRITPWFMTMNNGSNSFLWIKN